MCCPLLRQLPCLRLRTLTQQQEIHGHAGPEFEVVNRCEQCKLLRAEAKAQKFTVEPKHSSLPIASEAVNALLKQN